MNDYVAPTNFIETTLTEIWQKVLKIEKIGIEDHFLELGGNSLLATQIVNRIVKRLGVQVSLANFFDTPTITQMAEIIYHIQSTSTNEDDLLQMIDEIEQLSPEEIADLLKNN